MRLSKVKVTEKPKKRRKRKRRSHGKEMKFYTLIIKGCRCHILGRSYTHAQARVGVKRHKVKAA